MALALLRREAYPSYVVCTVRNMSLIDQALETVLAGRIHIGRPSMCQNTRPESLNNHKRLSRLLGLAASRVSPWRRRFRFTLFPEPLSHTLANGDPMDIM